jgi:hypothetical protein
MNRYRNIGMNKQIQRHVIATILILSTTVIGGQFAYADSNSLYIPSWERGYVESWNKLPTSSHHANYTDGYRNGIHDRNIWGKQVNFGSFPSHTNDNYKRFYAGFHNGVSDGDLVYSGTSNGTARWDNHNNLLCPSGHHTNEYCTGYNYGYNVVMFANNPPDTS